MGPSEAPRRSAVLQETSELWAAGFVSRVGPRWTYEQGRDVPTCQGWHPKRQGTYITLHSRVGIWVSPREGPGSRQPSYALTPSLTTLSRRTG